jgi:hypothetical protein
MRNLRLYLMHSSTESGTCQSTWRCWSIEKIRMCCVSCAVDARNNRLEGQPTGQLVLFLDSDENSDAKSTKAGEV